MATADKLLDIKMPKKYSTGVSPEHHEAMMGSVNARAERRAEQLAALPVSIGQVFRGRLRDSEPSRLSPPVIHEQLIIQAGKKFANEKGIITSKFSENIPVLTTSSAYTSYVTGGNRHNRRFETDPKEKEQARLAKMRQTQHVSDRLHKETWLEWQTARLFVTATDVIKRAIWERRTLDQAAAFIGASALEDFGHSLLESGRYKDISSGGRLARSIIDAAYYGSEDPAVLRAQSPWLYLMVQQEQERREQLWGDMLGLYEQDADSGWGGYRRARADEADEQINRALINQLQTSAGPVE